MEEVQQETEAFDPQIASPQEISSSEALPSAKPQPQAASVNVSQGRGENVRKLQNSWTDQAPIAVKPVRKASPVAAPSPTRANFNQAPSQVKYALPGLSNTNVAAVSPPSPPLTPPLVVRSESTQSRPPQSPRHSRIPSTGNRPTVMDVAQAFSVAANGSLPSSPTVTSPRSPVPPEEPQMHAHDHERDPGGWGEPDTNERTITPAMLKAERRRSNYEKYANFMLPVLTEEKTPAPSPVQTLKQKDEAAAAAEAAAGDVTQETGKEEKTVEELIATAKPAGEQVTKVRIGE